MFACETWWRANLAKWFFTTYRENTPSVSQTGWRFTGFSRFDELNPSSRKLRLRLW
ncbi:hypothetical protein RISK_004690 [Rhodopirellula islandica]|uniref:Uncharacterized protein n=1 Tax=Rhodopirellula islandica TaxID=595434 RepID=A0A0J1BA57_RHOIS|nr:hypothetical protein RISK_004690 [Rhodopirellula islandica]